MILVTGGTGHLGSSVIAQLLKISSTEHFIASSSNLKGVANLQNKGLQARLANFEDKSSLNKAFKGIDKILLISTMEANRFEQHKNVIDAAKAQGVRHIVYTSLAIKNINTSAIKDLMLSHFQTEDYLKESGITYTILRNTMYADALTQILGAHATSQNINLPGGMGQVPYALRREMGEGIANLLLQDGHNNKTYNITGSQLFKYDEVAKALSILTKNEIQYLNITEEDYINKLKKDGFSDFLIYLNAGTIRDIKETQYEIQSNILEQLLGRPTASLNEFIKELFNLK